MNYSVDHDEYFTLRDCILRIPHMESKIGELKTLFESEVNSNRRYSKIKTIMDLIIILEKRDFLNKGNILYLRKIKTLLELETNSSNTNIPNDPINTSYIRNNNILGNVPNVNLSSIHNTAFTYRNLCDPVIKHKVYKKIATEIGRKWIEFGRILKVREHLLDELKDKRPSIEERVYTILKFHEEECDPRYWKSELLDGLVDARRKDLMKKVQHIFDMNNE